MTATVTVTVTGFIPTASASRYLAQLCKHWAHNLAVDHQGDRGTIVFPKDVRGADWPADAIVTIDARPDGMGIEIAASAAGQAEALTGALERHIDRFAFRELPLDYRWDA